MGNYDKENIGDYRKLPDFEKENIEAGGKLPIIDIDSHPFRAIDGSYHTTMEEVQVVNEEYWRYKNPLIIDKDSELFSAPLSQGEIERIAATPTYHCLIDVLQDRVISQHLGEDKLVGMKGENNMDLLSDEEYNKKMEELGLVEDESLGKYFLGDMAFLMNLDDSVTSLDDLVNFNNSNHPTYMSQVLMDFSRQGAKLTIGPGAIDERGVKHKNALYCTNYRDLYRDQINGEDKPMVK